MAVEKVNASSSLAEVVDRILDKGIVIDAWVRVPLVGIELKGIGPGGSKPTQTTWSAAWRSWCSR